MGRLNKKIKFFFLIIFVLRSPGSFSQGHAAVVAPVPSKTENSSTGGCRNVFYLVVGATVQPAQPDF